MVEEKTVTTLDQITELVGDQIKPADRKTVRCVLLDNNLKAYQPKPNDISEKNRKFKNYLGSGSC